MSSASRNLISTWTSCGLSAVRHPASNCAATLGSQSAKAIGSFNISGIALPVVDALIDKMIAAKSREDLMFTGRALDRVLRAEHFWVLELDQGQPLDRPLGYLRKAADQTRI